jgi:NADH-quinone oxidoreductase subunit J
MTPAVKAIFSFLLLGGLVTGLGATIMLSLARFFTIRRKLGGVAFLGYALFLWGLMVLTPPPVRVTTFYFWLFTAAIVGGGIGCVTMRNVFHAALMLILCLFGVGGYFVLTNAEFLAMVQVIIYIGGIMVLFLFGIMVSQNIIGQEVQQLAPQAPWAALGATVLFLFMAFIGLTISFPPQPTQGAFVLESNTQAVGWSLMATFSLPFEVASILLLMAMLGAIVLVRKD